MSAPNLTIADSAVLHVLRAMQNDGRIAYLMGYGSRSFELLTEAVAERTGEDLVELRTSIWRNCNPERVVTEGASA